jgi:restriction system protein
MQKGDWVALPSKRKPAIHLGDIKGGYDYHSTAECPYYHSRDVKWFATDIPRTNFDSDILALLGMPKTICPVERNNAEARVRAMAQTGWRPVAVGQLSARGENAAQATEVPSDLDQGARDQIAKLIQAKFTGHGMARLVDAVMRAQGYTTHLSPPGAEWMSG